MRKSKLLAVAFACLAGSAFAQTDTQSPVAGDAPAPVVSKKGVPILPKAGDFGLGFDAVPLFRFVGNAFNNSTDNSLNSNFVNNPNTQYQIFGKYFLGSEGDAYTSLKAVRARVRIGSTRTTANNLVIQDNQLIPDPNVQVEDQKVSKTTDIQLGLGMEWRRGSGRLYGIYGAEVSYLYGSAKTDYTYGNAFSTLNQSPTTTTDFGDTNNSSDEDQVPARISSRKSGARNGLGANAFVGVEYFVAPRVSFSAEFTWGLTYTKTGFGQQEIEKFDAERGVTTTYTTRDTGNGSGSFAKGSNFQLNTGNYGGSINLMFYF